MGQSKSPKWPPASTDKLYRRAWDLFLLTRPMLFLVRLGGCRGEFMTLPEFEQEIEKLRRD